jgi:homoserine dehydrogenase
MILSALVFGRQLRRGDVACVPITGVTSEEVQQAASSGRRIRHIATLSDDGAASVRPEAVPLGDRLATVDGAANALVYVADPVGEITIIGPGAGPRLAGQGVLSDILAVTRRR